MHTVMWTFKVPAGTSKAQLIETINATAHTYEGIPGLIRKYYGIAPDGGSLVDHRLPASFAFGLTRRCAACPNQIKEQDPDLT